jgi:SIR2-like domain
VPLDPIVSLSVAIAEAPGSYAFFLGSGVSRDAGVPTGGEVFWRAVGELYRLENSTSETLEEGRLREWLEQTGRADVGYSDMLELITPDQATRREYLAKHFEGIEPGPTHERLADFAAPRLIKVFVTTNFDRLLERALQARGIEPIVVTSDADLAVAPVREHARCYVLKPHGDYLQQTIRNTPAELAELEPAMTAELEEVFSRYGLVVLGYSGADPAIAEAMRARRSR